MTTHRLWLRGLLAVVLIACTPALFIQTPARSAPEVPTRHDGRIVFPEHQPALMDLPDGRKRMVRSLLDIRRPLRYGDYFWNDRGVPAGQLWVRVDLKAQTLSVFRADQEVGAAVILYGMNGKPTPAGRYAVLEKSAEHSSTLYDAAMPYMLRLTADGIAIHASDVRDGAATHGCIGVPREFARLLFNAAKRGDEVIVA